MVNVVRLWGGESFFTVSSIYLLPLGKEDTRPHSMSTRGEDIDEVRTS